MQAIAAVTGATGGLGRALLPLLRARGLEVKAAVRSAQQAERAASLGAEPVTCDVTDAGSLAALVTGAGVVYHLAAWMGSPAGRAEAVNVEGTRNLLDAAAAAGVRHAQVPA